MPGIRKQNISLRSFFRLREEMRSDDFRSLTNVKNENANERYEWWDGASNKVQ